MTKPVIIERKLFADVAKLIEDSRSLVAQTVNSALTLLYWRIGKRANQEVLLNRRAEYGKKIISNLAAELIRNYGSNFSEKNLRRMIQFAEVFPDERIVVLAIRQLSWTHFIALIPLQDPLQRDFYTEICRIEGWSVKTLREKIDGMLYERIAISKKPDERIDPDVPKLSSAAKKMKKDLEAAFKEVKLHQEGKIQLKTLSEVLDEL